MPAPNIDLLDGPQIAYRSKRVVAVGAVEIVFDVPVTVRVASFCLLPSRATIRL